MLTNTAVLTVPKLGDVALLATFGAFKVDDKISFIRPYSPTVQAVEGFRHAVVRYRNTDKAVADKPAKMVTVPVVVLPEEYSLIDERARKVILGVFEDEQDNMIRSMIDTQQTVIHWDNVSLEKILDSLTAIRVSNRLTKEQIEGWSKIAFLASCNERADQISEAKKYDTEQSAKQRAGTLNAYCNLAMKLAAPVPNIGQGEATALKNMLLVAKLDDDMAKVLLAKLQAILEPKIIANADL